MSAASIKFGPGIVNGPQRCCQWLQQFVIPFLRIVFGMLFSLSCSVVCWSAGWLAGGLIGGLFCVVCRTRFVCVLLKTGHYRNVLCRVHDWNSTYLSVRGALLRQSLIVWHSCRGESQDRMHQWLLWLDFLCFSLYSRGLFMGWIVPTIHPQSSLPFQVSQNAG